MGVDPENELVKALLAHDEQAAIDVVGDMPSAATYGLSKHAVARAVRRRRMAPPSAPTAIAGRWRNADREGGAHKKQMALRV